MNDSNDVRYDYRGTPITRYLYEHYPPCVSCGKYVWKSSRILQMCPLCVLDMPTFDVKLSFGISRSKYYNKAVKLAASMSGYSLQENRHIIHFASPAEYCESRHKVNELNLMIFQWASYRVTMSGIQIESNSIHALYHEIERMLKKENAVDITFINGNAIYTLRNGNVFREPIQMFPVSSKLLLDSHNG